MNICQTDEEYFGFCWKVDYHTIYTCLSWCARHYHSDHTAGSRRGTGVPRSVFVPRPVQHPALPLPLIPKIGIETKLRRVEVEADLLLPRMMHRRILTTQSERTWMNNCLIAGSGGSGGRVFTGRLARSPYLSFLRFLPLFFFPLWRMCE